MCFFSTSTALSLSITSQRDDALAIGRLQVAIFDDPLLLDRLGSFLVLGGDDHLSLLVLFGDGDLFLGGDAGPLRP